MSHRRTTRKKTMQRGRKKSKKLGKKPTADKGKGREFAGGDDKALWGPKVSIGGKTYRKDERQAARLD